MIRLYEEIDLNEIIKITRHLWSNEVKMSKELEEFTYDFLVRYYLIKNEYSYVYINNGVKAFALANRNNETNDSLIYFKNNVKKLSLEDQKNAKEYLDYLEYNHHKVYKYLNDDDLYFSLFASIEKHAGSRLLNNLIEQAKKNNIKNIYFWTDETCNYQYYEKKGFNKIEEYLIVLLGKSIKTFIYKISI
ncbi:MAG: GNAT family N-acetyltransferase [Bacillales bacterium]|nr:GNAT family N-acetyltransferase [Bacillales bacterium]